MYDENEVFLLSRYDIYLYSLRTPIRQCLKTTTDTKNEINNIVDWLFKLTEF